MKLTFRGACRVAPLGGCRMAESKDYGVVDHRNEVFDNEGLFCIDSSAIPTSLGVNPSLTISAVSERAVAQLIDRAADYGLPAKPAGFTPGVPGVILGPHTTPVRAARTTAIDAKVRSYAVGVGERQRPRRAPPAAGPSRRARRTGRRAAAAGRPARA